MMYGVGATWNPKMSQYNRGLKRQLSDVGNIGFAYRLNMWGPKSGPPMLPANLTGAPRLSGAVSWFEGVLGIESTADILTDALTLIQTDLNNLPSVLTTLQNYLTQLQPYDSNSNPTVASQAQALEAQTTGLSGTVQNWQTTGQQLLGSVTTAQADSTTTSAAATTLKTQAQNYDTGVQNTLSQVSQLGTTIAAFLKSAGAPPSVVQAVENTVISSISNLTWLFGAGLLAYFLLPTFLPRLAGGVKKTIDEV